MTTLRIEQPVTTFEAWQRAFDADPVGRKAGGVRRYRVHRTADDPPILMIDLDFDGPQQAGAFLEKLKSLWSGQARDVVLGPRAFIVETVECVEL